RTGARRRPARGDPRQPRGARGLPRRGSGGMILSARDVVTGYGLGAVVHGVSFDVDAREVVCLLGRNGAGKSTTLRSVMGLTPPRAGRVEFMGEPISGRPPFEIARRGIGY